MGWLIALICLGIVGFAVLVLLARGAVNRADNADGQGDYEGPNADY